MGRFAFAAALAVVLTGCPRHGHLKPPKPKLEIKPMAPAAEFGPEDPVCGRTVDLGSAPRIDLAGRSYAFCSPACRERFRAGPPRADRGD